MGKINDIFANFFDDNFICLDHRYSILFFFMTLVEQQRRIRHHESLCIMSYWQSNTEGDAGFAGQIMIFFLILVTGMQSS